MDGFTVFVVGVLVGHWFNFMMRQNQITHRDQ